MIYGYVRVSTREQNEARQMKAMSEIEVPTENIYMDKQSGKDFKRPMYNRMVRRLREDDVIFVKSIDRLGRNYEEILEQWRFLTKEKKVDIVVLDMELLDTRRGKRNLPDNFEQVCYQWKSGEILGKEAARLCSMPLSTFYGRAREIIAQF